MLEGVDIALCESVGTVIARSVLADIVIIISDLVAGTNAVSESCVSIMDTDDNLSAD